MKYKVHECIYNMDVVCLYLNSFGDIEKILLVRKPAYTSGGDLHIDGPASKPRKPIFDKNEILNSNLTIYIKPYIKIFQIFNC